MRLTLKKWTETEGETRHKMITWQCSMP